MKRPLPARLLSEAWDAVIEAKAASGHVNVSAIATTIRRTGRFQNVPLPGIEKAVLHATLAVGAVIEFDKGENPAAALRLPGSGATVQSDGVQLSMLQEK